MQLPHGPFDRSRPLGGIAPREGVHDSVRQGSSPVAGKARRGQDFLPEGLISVKAGAGACGPGPVRGGNDAGASGFNVQLQ
jgi:hypothetical protein